MITRRILLGAFLTATLGGLSFYLALSPAETTTSEENHGPNSAFSSERLEWEWNALHDPATGKIPYGMRQREIAFAATLPRRDRGLYSAKKGRTGDHLWRNRGPNNVGGRTRAFAFDVTNRETLLAAGVSSGVWRSSDLGETWELTTTPEQTLGATAIVQDTREGKTHVWYYGTGEGRGSSASTVSAYYVGDGIYRSTDSGRSWTHLPGSSTGTPATRDVTDIVWNLALDPSNLDEDELYAAVDGAVRRSTDGGETWETVLGDNWTDNAVAYSDVVVTTEGVVYAMISTTQLRQGIYRSEDGISFTRITPLLFPRNYNRGVFAIAPSNQNRVYLIAETPRQGKGTGFFDQADAFFHSLWTYEYISGDGTNDGGKWKICLKTSRTFDPVWVGTTARVGTTCRSMSSRTTRMLSSSVAPTSTGQPMGFEPLKPRRGLVDMDSFRSIFPGVRAL